MPKPHPTVITVLMLLGAGATSAGAAELTFAPLPMEAPATVIKQTKPMLDHIEMKTGHKIAIRYFKDYADILGEMRAGKLDMAYLGPLPYVELHNVYEAATPIARFLDADGNETYTCSIMAATKGPDKLEALSGVRVALTQPLSTCGFFAVEHLLRGVGRTLKDNKYDYAGSHSNVAMALVRGEFDAGGLQTSIGEQYTSRGIRELARTNPLPGFVLVGNEKTMAKEVRESIGQALLALRPKDNPDDARVMKTWGSGIRNGAVPADDKDFAAIRDGFKGMEIPAKGNL